MSRPEATVNISGKTVNQAGSSANAAIVQSIAALDISAGFSAYIHIPFCSVRCGYCDFNTYTNLNFPGGANAARFADTLMQEIDSSAAILSTPINAPCIDAEPFNYSAPLINTVFFGGGTPTLLPARDLARILNHLRDVFGIKQDAEITTEANPESATPETLDTLASAGFTRISFGMQSAVASVLHTLERRHTPGQLSSVTAHAQALGLDYSLDLIYGTPGESLDDWRRSLDAAIELEPSHISAYALTLEPHVPMARKIARAEIADIDPDEQADKYEIAEHTLSSAGYRWYEISNWAQPGYESRHNLTYWREGNWWGYGPGAHSHMDGIRWWNLKHPLAYAHALYADTADQRFAQTPTARGISVSSDAGYYLPNLPIDSGEYLTSVEMREERIMLGIRLREGLPMSVVLGEHDTSKAFSSSDSSVTAHAGMEAINQLIYDGLIDERAARDPRDPKVRLTLRGRLLADTVIRALW